MRGKISSFLPAAALLVACSAAFAQGVWTTNSPVPFPFGREGACIAGSSAPDVAGVTAFRIYIMAGFGGFVGDSTTNTAYDPATDSYTLGLAPLPAPARSEGSAVSRSGFLYCLGGRAGTTLTTNHRYDPTTDSWAVLPPMPVPVASEYSAVVVGAQIHVIGGRTGFATVPFSFPKTVAHQVFHVGKGTWSFDPPLPGPPRSEMCAVAHGSKIHVLGGDATGFAASTSHDIYDVAQKVWTAGAPLPAPRANAACAVLGNSIYVNGGVDPPGFFHATTFRYDIVAGTWTTDTPKPTATAETPGIAHGGQMFVIGGGFFGVGPASINESFRPTPP